MDERVNFRSKVLTALGADAATTEELLAYNQNRFKTTETLAHAFPFPDEEFVEAWQSYRQCISASADFSHLARFLVQLNFPVRKGIGQDPDYLEAVRTGRWQYRPESIPWLSPSNCTIDIVPTFTGHIPVVTLTARSDFELFIQAMTKRNEPLPLPCSMGATMVAGYNNWDRIHQLRRCFENGSDHNRPWSEEFSRIKANRRLYQDRFIVLSWGNYSGVSAADMQLDEPEWLALSHSIRQEHECTHYFTKRVFGVMQDNILDELLADFAAIKGATGKFRADWMLRFLGLEQFPEYRPGGRLENYSAASLSSQGFAVLKQLVYEAALNLEQFDQLVPDTDQEASLMTLLAIATCCLEEIASKDGPQILSREIKRLSCLGLNSGRPSFINN